MKNSVLNKAVALMIAVLLTIGMSPAIYAARTARTVAGSIKLEKSTVRLEYGKTATIMVEYENIDDKAIVRANVASDDPEVATAEFDRNGSDISSIVIKAGEADGTTKVTISAGNVTAQCTVTVGKGANAAAQARQGSTISNAEKTLIENDKSELGLALAAAIKKTTKKEVIINTTYAKHPAIPVETLKVLSARANQGNKNAYVRIDAPDANGKLQSQLFINPDGFTNLKSDFKAGVTIDYSRAALGSKYIASVKLAQTGSFNRFVEVAVRVNAPKDVSTLSIYNVDANGKLKKIEEPSCSIGKNGLLSFYTKAGGEIVIVNGTL